MYVRRFLLGAIVAAAVISCGSNDSTSSSAPTETTTVTDGVEPPDDGSPTSSFALVPAPSENLVDTAQQAVPG